MQPRCTKLQVEALDRLIAPAPMVALPAGVTPAIHVGITSPVRTPLLPAPTVAVPGHLRDALLSQADRLGLREIPRLAHPGAVDPSPETSHPGDEGLSRVERFLAAREIAAVERLL